MPISLTRLSGGNSPADGSDPRTFPAIWNASATAIEDAIATIPEGGASVTVSETAPVSPAEGDLWLNSTEAKMYVYYDDDTSEQWVAAVGGTVPSQGKILQVVSTTKTDTFSTSSTSFTAITGLSASITPSSASSKVLIIAQVSLGFPSSVSDSGSRLLLTGGNTSAYKGDTAGSRTRAIIGPRSAGSSAGNYNHGNTIESETIVFLDSPATTSSVTYGFEIASNTANNVFVNRAGDDGDTSLQTRGASSITVMEVAG
jgi:hypothetical protein